MCGCVFVCMLVCYFCVSVFVRCFMSRQVNKCGNVGDADAFLLQFYCTNVLNYLKMK